MLSKSNDSGLSIYRSIMVPLEHKKRTIERRARIHCVLPAKEHRRVVYIDTVIALN